MVKKRNATFISAFCVFIYYFIILHKKEYFFITCVNRFETLNLYFNKKGNERDVCVSELPIAVSSNNHSESSIAMYIYIKANVTMHNYSQRITAD